MGVQAFIVVGVDAEDIIQAHLRTESNVHVVAKDKTRAQYHHVPGGAVIIGGQPLAGHQPGLDGAESFLAGGIELTKAGTQFAAVGEQAVANDLVSAALQLD